MKSKPYIPPKVWTWQDKEDDDSLFSKLNRPVAGATHDTVLPVGDNPIQVYSMGTANSIKIAIMLEELLEIGKTGAHYDRHIIDIFKGDQFGSGFVEINPNSKIPAIVDHSASPPIRVFESGAILLYLAQKFEAFLPTHPSAQAECLSWLFWQIGSAPYLGGGFGHFYAIATEKYEYPINRFTMEVKRQLDLVNQHFENNTYLCGNEYTIADISLWPWMQALINDGGYNNAAEFLDVNSYTHLVRWTSHIGERGGAKRGYATRTRY